MKVVLKAGKTVSSKGKPFLKLSRRSTHVSGMKSFVSNSLNIKSSKFVLSRSFSTCSLKRQNETSNPIKPLDVVDEEETASLTQDELIKSAGLIKETEQVHGEKEVKTFQTETRQLLDIVAQSLYTDKEVFIRELISNASDALEKFRELTFSEKENLEDIDKPLEISLSVDERMKTFTIQDSGIGMTKEELVKNLGTIARSGSKEFVKSLRDKGKTSDAMSNIIGQFGVGFYSVFMVASKVKVYSRSALKGSTGYFWESFGTGEYSISEAEGVARGTKIILELKDDDKEFSIKESVERIIKKYSNFVTFDINLNGSKVNTQKAIWVQPKTSVTQEEYKEFFKFISHSNSEPFYTLHFTTEIPMNIHGLFYVPDYHSEKMGMGKMDPGVNVYCRKILIQAKHRDILPDWLRFLKGAVDSEDLPLHISREHLQNSPLIRRINGILTRKVLRFLEDMLKADIKKYSKFYDEYGKFLKEGISGDLLYKDELSKLLIFDTSAKEGEKITLGDYVSRMPADQTDIYYLVAPTREFALKSPYYEVFQKKNIEVIFLYQAVDEFVMTSVGTFQKKPIKSVERTELPDKGGDQMGLSQEDVKVLESWLTNTALKGKLISVKSTTRLSGTPAIISNPENPAMRMMRKMYGEKTEVGPQKMEINPQHPMILKLYTLLTENEKLARVVAEQVYNNAMISAGLVDDARAVVGNINDLMEYTLKDVAIPRHAALAKPSSDNKDSSDAATPSSSDENAAGNASSTSRVEEIKY